jgi:hypothetical protein
VAALAWIVITQTQLSHDLRTANEARDALARQVQQLGGTPVAGSPGSRGGIGPTGVAGPSGPSGPSGPVGATGPSGKSGTPGASGTPGQIGASGSPGSAGSAGDIGPSGPAGPQGDTGPAGPQGDKGDTGEQGPAGPNCPDGYSLQAPAYDPDALVCRADSTPAPTDSPSPNKGLLGVAVLTASAGYRKIGAHRAD